MNKEQTKEQSKERTKERTLAPAQHLLYISPSLILLELAAFCSLFLICSNSKKLNRRQLEFLFLIRRHFVSLPNIFSDSKWMKRVLLFGKVNQPLKGHPSIWFGLNHLEFLLSGGLRSYTSNRRRHERSSQVPSFCLFDSTSSFDTFTCFKCSCPAVYKVLVVAWKGARRV